MSRVFMLKPADGIEGVKEKILEAVRDAGPNACPPMVVASVSAEPLKSAPDGKACPNEKSGRGISGPICQRPGERDA